MAKEKDIQASNEIKSFKNVPIIAVTASVIFGQENKQHNIFDDFSHKPLQSNDLFHAICNFIKCELQVASVSANNIGKHLQNLSLKDYPNLEELFLNAKNNGDIELIQKFADELAVCGEKNSIESFKNISIQISSAVESFDIGECEILLNIFS